MRGIGSGRGIRPKARRSKKLKTISLPGLNVAKLIHRDKKSSGGYFKFQDLIFVVNDPLIRVENTKNEKLTTEIKISSKSCHFGGFQYFVCCPYCQRQVKILYLHDNLLACRHCFQMRYSSQNETLSFRLHRKRKKIGAKINHNEWEKPKWMRQKTFSKLRKEYFELDEKEQIADFFSLKNNQSVNEIFEKYGCALIAAEVWGMEHGLI